MLFHDPHNRPIPQPKPRTSAQPVRWATNTILDGFGASPSAITSAPSGVERTPTPRTTPSLAALFGSNPYRPTQDQRTA